MAGVASRRPGSRHHPGAVSDARTRLKPEIPLTGSYGIPIRDEIELEKRPL
ncbi:hypothetical protein [Actinomadura sp. 6N118]|uniref:hypothetical protein n=1 Tax=Actinomadura sp. 6N118 TaxID=3375151 RepID=UPI00378A40C6